MTEKNTQQNGKKAEEKKKVDIKALVALVPPASALKQRSSKTMEKRVRVRWGNIAPEKAKLSTSLANELGIGEELEIAISGKKFIFKAIKDDSIPPNEVHINEEVARMHGISDNTIATIRAHRRNSLRT